MYILITDDEIITFNSTRDIAKHGGLSKDDFIKKGRHYVASMTNDSHEIVKDISTLERVATQRVFKKDKVDLSTIIVIVAALICIFTYMKLGEVQTKQDLFYQQMQLETSDKNAR